MADEKGEEKDREKREEKSSEEKSWDEKWRRDPINTIGWAAVFIWAGLVLLADNLGYLDSLPLGNLVVPGTGETIDLGAWPLILIGAGVIVLLEVVARLLIPEYRRSVGGSIFFGIFLIALGLSNVISWTLIWPLFLIGLGLWIILRGVFRKR
jgi:vacuolar-type H+-ATPase subunit I/STV1